MNIARRSILTLVALIVACVATSLALSPAHAGGPGQVYVFGSTYEKCRVNLSNSIKLQRANDYTVTGVHPCRLAGDNRRYFGDYVANPN